jgi:hypothetical protein
MQTRLSTSSLNPTGCPGRGLPGVAASGEVAALRDEVPVPAEHAAPPRLFQGRRLISRAD